ncbi:MAG TPA: BTAD domain-containing putative transcriptional regulator, partial [Longimicrobiales bacterium]|nr:BTAD domain-containing putative transcriptional regulator [Longimicrobiales bacterium]
DYAGAAALYGGPFLDGFHISDAVEFERWVDAQRARLEDAYAKALQALAVESEQRHDLVGAVEWWRRLAAARPFDAHVVLRLAQALESNGDRAGALRHLHVHSAMIGAELGAEPDASIAELTKRLSASQSLSAYSKVVIPPPTGNELVQTEAATDAVGEPPGRRQTRPVRHRLSARIAATAAVVILITGYVGSRLRSRAPVPGEADADPTTAIAVLPFIVNQGAPASWREDLVVLMSANIDGVGSLRAIDGRTVLARVRDTRLAEPGAQLSSREAPRPTVEVARRVGARFGVQGNVLAIGSKVRLIADVYDTKSGERIGQPQLDGVPDSLMTLIDRLTVDIARTVLKHQGERADLTRIDLARRTTQSLPALKAYLEGERLRWGSHFADAAAAYQRAFDLDTLFALALIPFVYPGSFMGQFIPAELGDPLARVARIRERLPRRHALIVEAARALDMGRRQSGLELLRQASREFPDDAELWYALGEIALHAGGDLMLDPEEAVRAFAAAVALDSTFYPATHHLTEKTMAYHADRDLAARLVQPIAALGERREPGMVAPLAFALAYGNEPDRRRVLAVLDTLPLFLVVETSAFLHHPSVRDAYERVNDIIAKRGELGGADEHPYAVRAHVSRGRFGRAIATALRVARCPAQSLYWTVLLGAHDLPAAAQDLLSLAGAQASGCVGFATFVAGAYAADHARWT